MPFLALLGPFAPLALWGGIALAVIAIIGGYGHRQKTDGIAEGERRARVHYEQRLASITKGIEDARQARIAAATREDATPLALPAAPVSGPDTRLRDLCSRSASCRDRAR